MDPRAVRIRDNATVDMVQALRRLSPKVGTAVQPAIAANAMAASICSALIDVPAAARDEVLLDLFAWFDKGSFHRDEVGQNITEIGRRAHEMREAGRAGVYPAGSRVEPNQCEYVETTAEGARRCIYHRCHDGRHACVGVVS